MDISRLKSDIKNKIWVINLAQKVSFSDFRSDILEDFFSKDGILVKLNKKDVSVLRGIDNNLPFVRSLFGNYYHLGKDKLSEPVFSSLYLSSLLIESFHFEIVNKEYVFLKNIKVLRNSEHKSVFYVPLKTDGDPILLKSGTISLPDLNNLLSFFNIKYSFSENFKKEEHPYRIINEFFKEYSLNLYKDISLFGLNSSFVESNAQFYIGKTTQEEILNYEEKLIDKICEDLFNLYNFTLVKGSAEGLSFFKWEFDEIGKSIKESFNSV